MVLKGAWDNVIATINHNIYWNLKGKEYDFNGLSFKAWQNKGFDKQSFLIDPNFINPLDTDFSFKNKKSYKKINFIPFETSKSGVYGNKEWLEKAKLPEFITKSFDEVVLKNIKLNPERG